MKITINDSELTVKSGITILEAAKKGGIAIPTLCYVEMVSDSSCELCMVEVKGMAEPVKACATKVQKGMEVVTDSEELKTHRKDRLERLAKTHFGDCKAPCNLTCPGQINVQGYIAHVAKGEYEEALRLVMERNPFPFSVGRVCPRFCETRCRRILVDEPVSINHLKRFVADWCMTNKVDLKLGRESNTGKKIAVIGGGPSGLTAAFYLSKKGNDVTVIEAMPKLGGMLRYGLPEYKIPRNVLDYEINAILRMGISVRLSQRWGTDFTLRDLQDQGFDAMLITIGTWADQPLEVPGGTLPKVMSARKLLKNIAEGNPVELGRRAAVVGGNNIAMEAARSLIRENVDEVTIIYPRAQTEMPANQRNIREAEKDGVQFLLMASPTQVMEGARGLDLELVRMKLGEPDKRGLRLPEAIPGSTNILRVDNVITSLGQSALAVPLTGGDLEEQLELTPKMGIKANPRTSLTNLDGIFAAGDATSGPRSVIQAVVSARRAAENIHVHVNDIAKAAGEGRFNFTRGKSFDNVDLKVFDGINVKLREKMPERPSERSTQDFDEVRLGFTETMARKEAGRCLSCGCTAFDRCDLKQQCLDHGVDPGKSGMGKKPRYKLEHSHKTLLVDRDKCIFCKRCQNSCKYDALAVSATSFDTLDNPLDISIHFNEKCVNCGKCVDNCSTGALNKKDAIVPIINEKLRQVKTTCPYCGTGCQLLLRVKGDTLMEVTADPDVGPNYGDLCVKGRFGHSFIHHGDRLSTPLVRRRKGGPLDPASWEEALDFVAGAFRCIIDEKGPDALAGLSSARCTNEENYAFQKFFRALVGTNNVDHCARY